jgi:hypothetical protein
MGGTCRKNEEAGERMQILIERCKERYHMGYRGECGRITLKENQKWGYENEDWINFTRQRGSGEFL